MKSASKQQKKTDILELIEREQVDESSEEKAKKHYGYSGGEKQKISVTRIILKDPTILLLDGVTASLDKESEIEILRALDELSQNKTTIIITHLFNVIKNCDKIFVFDKGRIVEQGTHEELMELKKRYYTIYNYSNAS